MSENIEDKKPVDSPKPEPTAPAPQQKPETMTLPVKTIEAMLARLESIEKAREEDQKKIKILESVASETRLKEARVNLDEDKRQRVHFKKIDNKVVIGWPEGVGEDKVNEIVFNNEGRPVGELLKCRFSFLDGTKSELIDQYNLTRSNDYAYARVLDDKGNFVILEFEDKSISDKTIEVHKKFLNA